MDSPKPSCPAAGAARAGADAARCRGPGAGATSASRSYTFGAAAALGALAGLAAAARTFVHGHRSGARDWGQRNSALNPNFRYPPRGAGGKLVVAAVVLGHRRRHRLLPLRRQAEEGSAARGRRAARRHHRAAAQGAERAAAGRAPRAHRRQPQGGQGAARPACSPTPPSEYIHGAREIVRRRGDAERLTREAAMSRRALAMHMAAASGRDAYWIRVATDLKKRVERDHSELDTRSRRSPTCCSACPSRRSASSRRSAPRCCSRTASGRAARERAEEAAKRAAEELEKVRTPRAAALAPMFMAQVVAAVHGDLGRGRRAPGRAPSSPSPKSAEGVSRRRCAAFRCLLRRRACPERLRPSSLTQGESGSGTPELTFAGDRRGERGDQLLELARVGVEACGCPRRACRSPSRPRCACQRNAFSSSVDLLRRRCAFAFSGESLRVDLAVASSTASPAGRARW